MEEVKYSYYLHVKHLRSEWKYFQMHIFYNKNVLEGRRFGTENSQSILCQWACVAFKIWITKCHRNSWVLIVNGRCRTSQNFLRTSSIQSDYGAADPLKISSCSATCPTKYELSHKFRLCIYAFCCSTATLSYSSSGEKQYVFSVVAQVKPSHSMES